ncbi:MAG TPA: secretin N-terminal domain-containing protein [Verrucomicrobiae bacterium]
MKKLNIPTILHALFAAGAVASAADADTNSASNTNAASAVAVATNAPSEPAEPIPTNGIVLNFHSVPLGTVLNYLSAKAGLVIVSDANLQGTVTVVARNPITTNEVVDLLNNQLSKNNLTAVLEGRTLNIMDSERAKTRAGTRVILNTTGPTNVPINDEIVTEILPVQTLSPEQLIKDLEPLIPRTASVSANEAGSAIIMTAPQRDIHRISEIISDLDSSSVSEVEVFVLKFADAKSVASELKEVFASADSDVASASRRNSRGGGFGGPFGGGGFPGFGGGGGGDNSSGTKNAQTHAIFSSDDQLNAVIASAPPSYMRSITNMIARIDQASSEVTAIKVFKLRHADPQEIADELSTMFPSTGSTDQNNRSMGFRFMPPWMQQQPAGNSKSDRMKAQTTVLAVADRRTQSITVTASREMMEEIKGMIAALDEGDTGVMKVTAFHLNNADPASVQQSMAGLFLNQGNASSSTTSDAISARTTANVNSQSTSTSSSTSFFGGSTGGGGGSGVP